MQRRVFQPRWLPQKAADGGFGKTEGGEQYSGREDYDDGEEIDGGVCEGNDFDVLAEEATLWDHAVDYEGGVAVRLTDDHVDGAELEKGGDDIEPWRKG